MEWLYKDIDDKTRWFTDEICRPDNSEPWMECYDESKQEWEEAHLQPESETELESEAEESNGTEAE